MDRSSRPNLLEPLIFLRPPVNSLLDLGVDIKKENLSKATECYQLKELNAKSLIRILKTVTKIKAYNDTPLRSPYDFQVSTALKSTQTSFANIFTRRRESMRSDVHATLSDHDNFFGRKKIVLVLSGRKRNVYTIKNTESENFTGKNLPNHEKISLDQISSLKLVLDSLNMNDKKGKDVRKKKKTKTFEDANECGKNEVLRECMCLTEHKMREPLSKVRITGQLGLSEDNRYVLNCAATVNNGVDGAKYYEGYDYFRSFANKEQRRHQDFTVQTDTTHEYRRNRNDNIGWGINNLDPTINKQSQSTQVDLYVNSKNEPLNNLTLQNNIDREIHVRTVNNANDLSLRRNKSPLVVISVYPIQEYSDKSAIKSKNNLIKEQTTTLNVNETPQVRKCNSPQQNIANINKSPRSLSRSPHKKKSEKFDKEINDATRRSRKSSPLKVVNKTSESKGKFKVNEDKVKIKRNEKDDMATNTEHNITKKMLVDSYTKQYMAIFNKNNREYSSTVPCNSSIKVNGDINFTNCKDDGKQLKKDNDACNLNDRKYPATNATAKKNKNNVLNKKNAKEKHTSPSNTGYRKKLQKDSQLRNRISRLQVRDSLEISHRREEADHSKPKTVANAPRKHFRGDSCSIPDPLKRDQEIRALLGIRKDRHNPNTTVYPVKNTFNYNMCCIYDAKCNDKSLCELEETNLIKKPSTPQCGFYYNSTSKNTPDNNPTYGDNAAGYLFGSMMFNTSKFILQSDKQNYISKCPYSSTRNNMGAGAGTVCTKDLQRESHLDEIPMSVLGKCDVECECDIPRITVSQQFYQPETSYSDKKQFLVSIASQYEEPRLFSQYQEIIANKTFQVYFQLDHTKQKPIILSRKQYAKLKMALENARSNSQMKNKKNVFNKSSISVGDVRKRTKHQLNSIVHNKDTQTVIDGNCFNINKGINGKSSKQSASRSAHVIFFNKYNVNRDTKIITPRLGTSSVDIRCTNISFNNHETVSSTKVEAGSIDSTSAHKDSPSLHTIFKGHRRCPTPNLGVSAYSLNSDRDEFRNSKAVPLPVHKSKEKKPLLSRLMSCFVMRAATGDMNPDISKPKTPSAQSTTIDSYHISTAFCAPELTSSIYDTSASFYSNHSVFPVTSRTKRGFFSSVRELLRNRKS